MNNFNVGDIASIKDEYVKRWGVTHVKVINVLEKKIEFILLSHGSGPHLIGKTFTYPADMFNLLTPVNETVSFFIN